MFNRELLREEILRRSYEEKDSTFIELIKIKINFNKNHKKVNKTTEEFCLNYEARILDVIDKFSKYDYENSSTGNYKLTAYCFPDEDLEMCIQTCLSDILGRIELDKEFLEGLENKIIELKKEL